MWSFTARLRAIGLLGAAVAFTGVGCEMATPVPPGAQIVRVTMTDAAVRLDPDTVRAGDVYLELDSPPGGSFSFVARQDSAEATPGPMTDAALQRLRAGDTFHTVIVSFGAGGCSPDQDAQALGKTGPCGNVGKVVVGPGRYAVVGGSPDAGPNAIGILTVQP